MTATSTPADRIREAADLLDRLDRAATPGPWIAADKGRNIAHQTERGPRGILSGQSRDDEDVALVVALRSTAGPVVTWLRDEADRMQREIDGFGWAFRESASDRLARIVGDHSHAVAVAEAVLGAAAGDTTKEKTHG